MKLLSLVHRWAGGVIGLLLAFLGLTGAILVWQGAWIGVPGAGDPVAEDAARIGAISEAAAAREGLSRITFAGDEVGLHQLVYADGSGAYVRQDGRVVEQWSSQWERPELWLFDFHHHLFAGDAGETVAGIAGIAGLLFVVTGAILWWRSRRAFRPRLLPERLAPGPIVTHHRDLGIVAMPLLLLSLLTGVLMLFAPVRTLLLGDEQRPTVAARAGDRIGPARAIELAKRRFPEARLRRITLPTEPNGAIVVRVRQPFEWTPNGRTQLSFSPDGNVTIADAASANSSAWSAEKLYPLHSAKVGGLAWKLAMTASGLALALLGSLATWSFWVRRADRRARRRGRLRLAPAARTAFEPR